MLHCCILAVTHEPQSARDSTLVRCCSPRQVAVYCSMLATIQDLASSCFEYDQLLVCCVKTRLDVVLLHVAPFCAAYLMLA